MFAVAEFKEGLHLVPSSWLMEGEKACFWPKDCATQFKINKMVMSQCKPESSWEELDVLKIHSKADTYLKGIKKLKLHEQLSDVDSEPQVQKAQRKFLKRKVQIDSDEDGLLHSMPEKSKVQKDQFKRNLKKKVVSDSDDDAEDGISRLSQSLLENYPKPPPKLEATTETCSLTFSTLEHQGLILEKLNYLINRVNSMEKKIDNLTKPTEGLTDEKSDVFRKDLPLSSMDQLEKFENFLKDENIFKNLVKTLKGIGGTRAPLLVNSLLKRMLTDELAEMFSWAGAKQKRAFKSLCLTKAVLEATRFFFASITEDEVGTIIANWLRHAKQRKERAKGLQQMVSFEVDSVSHKI